MDKRIFEVYLAKEGIPNHEVHQPMLSPMQETQKMEMKMK